MSEEIEKDNSSARLKHVMNWGAITGIMIIVVYLLMYILNQRKNIPLSLLSYAVEIIGTYWGCKTYRDQLSNKYISYQKCLVTGIKISFFASLIVAFYIYIFNSFVDDIMIKELLDKTEQSLINQDMPSDQIDQVLSFYRKYVFNPIGMAISTIIGCLIWGAILSLIISLFVKREDKSFEGGFLDQ